jgi:2-keto-3-deoxy-L-rhamnonate aldolase RhmA
VLDWGADGIMVPHVNSAAEAEVVVSAANYLPRGQRGYSRTVRAHDYGLRPPASTPAPVLMAQIETFAAVSRAAEIAAVDGMDILFVGPADLQLDLKHHTPAPPETYEDCLARVLEATQASGKGAGMLVRDFAELPRRLSQGFTHVAVQSDLAILRDGFQQILRTRREG